MSERENFNFEKEKYKKFPIDEIVDILEETKEMNGKTEKEIIRLAKNYIKELSGGKKIEEILKEAKKMIDPRDREHPDNDGSLVAEIEIIPFENKDINDTTASFLLREKNNPRFNVQKNKGYIIMEIPYNDLLN
ncbi:MAG: hypothetical protein WC430_01670 [Patescibacteria group bacterium]